MYPRAILCACAALALFATGCGSSSETETFTAPSTVRCAAAVASENTAFPPAGGSGNVRITISRDCQWTARAEAAWITLASGEGQGEASVRFTVASNADPASRNTTIAVNDQRLEIAQQGRPCEFTLSSHRESVDGNGGDRTIRVRATSPECTWTADTNEPWITIVSGHQGRGDGEVRFRVPGGGPSRTGTLTIAGQRVLVEQGTGCTYSISNDAMSVPPSGGDREIAVTAGPGCTWTAESQTPWIGILSGGSGNGSGAVVFRVPGTNEPERSGTLTVAGRVVRVVQAGGCSVSVGPASVSAPAAGTTAAIQVETAAGCAWSATTEVPWIAISGPAAGNGRAQVPLVISANAGPARTGSAVVGGQRVGVAQEAGCRFTVSPSAQQISGFGGPAAASVSTTPGCVWQAASSVPWITMATTSGNGPGQATFTIAPNPAPARSATITIAGQGHTVNQASQCTWRFVPGSHEMPAAGGFGAFLVILSGGQCSWTATSTVDWIRIVFGSSGTSDGSVQFIVSPNDGPARTGVILAAGEKYLVAQHAAR